MANGLFEGGDGSQKNPFLISDGSDLYQVRNHLSSYFKLVSNINLGEPPFNTKFGWESIKGFKGTIDGNNKRIYNLTIVRNEEDNIGLFADYTISTMSPISNVTFENVSIRGNDKVGAIVGSLTVTNGSFSTPIFNNVYISGTIEGNNYVGSFAGKIHFGISNVGAVFNLTQDCMVNTQLGLTNANNSYIGQIVGLCTDSWSNGTSMSNTSCEYTRTVGIAGFSNTSRKVLKPGNFSYDLHAKDKFVDCFLDTSWWQLSDFGNSNTGLQAVDSSVIKDIENQTAFSNILNVDGTHKWSLYDKQYPQLTIMVPDYIFVKADEHFFYYNFTNKSWEELTLNKNKKVPSREQMINYGIRSLQDIPQEKWSYFQTQFTTVNLYDGIDKTNTTFQHTVDVANSTLVPNTDSNKQSDDEKKTFMSGSFHTNSVFGILTSIKGW